MDNPAALKATNPQIHKEHQTRKSVKNLFLELYGVPGAVILGLVL